MDRKKKYTHITGRCSGFLRAGVSVRLKRHNYTISDAYWRLREGKGLVSLYDQETFRLVSNLITQIRRYMGFPFKLSNDDFVILSDKKEELLKNLEFYREYVESGLKPTYLTDNFHTIPIENVLIDFTNEKHMEMTLDEINLFWKEMPKEGFFEALQKANDKFEVELECYNRLPKDKKMDFKFMGWEKQFINDKVWQIRADFEHRSSKNANINEILNFIWDIPNLTDKTHRDIIQNNFEIVEKWRLYKAEIKENKDNKLEVDKVLAFSKLIDSIDGIKIPECISKMDIK